MLRAKKFRLTSSMGPPKPLQWVVSATVSGIELEGTLWVENNHVFIDPALNIHHISGLKRRGVTNICKDY